MLKKIIGKIRKKNDNDVAVYVTQLECSNNNSKIK